MFQPLMAQISIVYRSNDLKISVGLYFDKFFLIVEVKKFRKKTFYGVITLPVHNILLYLLSLCLSYNKILGSPKGFPGLCSCCPIKPPSFSPLSSLGSTSLANPLSSLTNQTPSLASLASQTPVSLASLANQTQLASLSSDPRSSSVAELRRKAQEHSAAVLQSLHAASLHNLQQSLHQSSALNIENLLKNDSPVPADRENSQ